MEIIGQSKLINEVSNEKNCTSLMDTGFGHLLLKKLKK